MVSCLSAQLTYLPITETSIKMHPQARPISILFLLIFTGLFMYIIYLILLVILGLSSNCSGGISLVFCTTRSFLKSYYFFPFSSPVSSSLSLHCTFSPEKLTELVDENLIVHVSKQL